MIGYGITTQSFKAFGKNAKILMPVDKDRLVIVHKKSGYPVEIVFSLPELPNLKLKTGMAQYIKMRE